MLESLHLEPSGVPIYVQLRDQLLRAIGAGVLKPGERMPTMRQVAIALKIDLNTVRHAYDALARTGAIVVQPARGTFVADRQPEEDPAVRVRRIDDLAQRTIASAQAGGLHPVEVAQRILALAQQKDGQS